jgi:hypothetical protein
MLIRDYKDCDVLNFEDAADLMLAAILDGTLSVLDDTSLVEVELMDTLAIKRAGGAHLVHWESGQHYN